jgi:hypothetical protein
MKEDEVDEVNKQDVVSETDVNNESTDMDRRRFFGGLATIIGTAAIGSAGLMGQSDPAEAKEIKSKILSRIQQQLNQEQGEEGMVYRKVAHDEYLKGGGGGGDPVPIMPVVAAD